MRRLAVLACVLPATLAPSSLSGRIDNATHFDQRLLAVHNRERALLGIAPLDWNEGLTDAAQAWADHLARTDKFEHAPDGPGEPQGENIWAGTLGYFGPEQMVDAWAKEKRHFKPGKFPNNSTTGDFKDVSHYTQLVWRSTTSVGCAKATGKDEEILVCRYAKAGNYRGVNPF